MMLPSWDGWHLIGTFPDSEPDDVGSWLLHHNGEVMLLEVPEGLRSFHVTNALRTVGGRLCYITASHLHEDHLDEKSLCEIMAEYPEAEYIAPSSVRGDRQLYLGDEPVWLVKAPKHSVADVVTVFRGVAMTGDIELGMLESVNDEVPWEAKIRGMARLRGFQDRTGYHVHSVVSAHVNDVRTGVDWECLFDIGV